MSGKLLEEIEKRLKAKTIHELRQVARALGVPRPADGRKERILEYILQIASGKSDPAEPSVRGAHPKSSEYDRQLVADVLRCREICLSEGGTGTVYKQSSVLSVGSGVGFDPLDFISEGILEKTDGKWFLRVNGGNEDFITDIFVSDYFVNAFGLREGDCVSGKCKRSSLDEIAGLSSIKTVNGCTPETARGLVAFEKLTPVYPDRHLQIARSRNDLTGRIIDLFAPVGAGQRAFVVAPHGCGKTSVLKGIACGLKKNNSQAKVILVLIDARPEEASDFKRAFPDTDVFVSLIGAGANAHVRTANLALQYAKRIAEKGLDSVLVLDDLTRLARAYNSCGRQVSGYLEVSALDEVKKYLSAAKNTEEGASLTIISALSTGGDYVDDAVYSGLKDLCNMRITLSGQLARMRVYPPVDMENTYTSGDEKLLDANTIKVAAKLRCEPLQKIISLLDETDGNEELCGKF